MNKIVLRVASMLLLILLASAADAQIAAGKCKFLGNIIPSWAPVPTNFNQYWNQVTAENAGKWGSVESSRDNMDWTYMDRAYDLARNSVFPFKWHTFVWGNQQPGWIGNLSKSEQREEVEEWIELYAERYPNTDYIDVVNEPLHAPPIYSEALGGAGSTGWDWVVWSFKKAREYLPDAELHINDYGIINSTSNTTRYLELIEILMDSNLIDGIGVQGHGLENTSLSILQSNLDKLAETGLPVYITEYDVDIANDQQQYQVYFDQFPILWEHPSVAGVTLWGYNQGQMWKANAYLVRSDGSERPALTWLRTYVLTAFDIPCYSPPVGVNNILAGEDMEVNFYPNPVTAGVINLYLEEGIEHIKLLDLSGRIMRTTPTNGETRLSMELEIPAGLYLMQFEKGKSILTKKLLVY